MKIEMPLEKNGQGVDIRGEMLYGLLKKPGRDEDRIDSYDSLDFDPGQGMNRPRAA
jgi:hypothetical protein